MQDIKIWWCKLNARDELVFKVTVKAGDYTPVELQLLKNAEINWDLLDLSFTWLTNWDIEKQRKEKISKLVYLMWLYCEKSNQSLEIEKRLLYNRNKVDTRADLTDWQLDYEIELYKNGLLEFNS